MAQHLINGFNRYQGKFPEKIPVSGCFSWFTVGAFRNQKQQKVARSYYISLFLIDT